MRPLTERQIAIIKAVVEEYFQTAQPVSSSTVDKKYNLGVSPATIRNEMVRLTDLGYLVQPHTSAGRLPTSQAIKLYITELLKEQDLSITEEINIKEYLWNVRQDLDELMKAMVSLVSRKTQALSLAVTQEPEIYSSGYANILSFPEFFDIDTVRTALSMIEMPQQILQLLDSHANEGDYAFLVGDDLPSQHLHQCAIVYTSFQLPSQQKGYVGILGPSRINYAYTIPLLRSIHSLLTEIFEG